MVSNYDRIYSEIKEHAGRVEGQHGVAGEELTALVMEIVDLEDQHRIKAVPRINQQIGNMIDQAAKANAQKEKA